MHRPRIHSSPRIRYSRELQRKNEQKSLVFKVLGAIVFLVLIIYFFRDSEARPKETDPLQANLNEIHPDVKSPEKRIYKKPLPKIQKEKNPNKYKYSDSCEDQPELLNEGHKSCKIRLEMVQHMGLTCDDDKNTAEACCKSCKANHLTHEHAHRKRNIDGEVTNEECLDSPFSLEPKYGSGYTCQKLLEMMYFIGDNCHTSAEAQEHCCHSCMESKYWDENHCEDYPHLLEKGDCHALFKRLSSHGSVCMNHDESRFCCKSCAKLEMSYGEKQCLDHDYKLNVGTCKARVLELQKMGKMCDDDSEIAEHCCTSCNAHEFEGCFDTMYRIDGKTCKEAVKELGDTNTPCRDKPELEERCCRSCDPEGCYDSFELVRSHDCHSNVKNMKALGITCEEEPEIKAQCCSSCHAFNEESS